MSTHTEDKDLETATVDMYGDAVRSQTDTRAVTVTGAPPEVFAGFMNKSQGQKRVFRRSVPPGSYAVTAKAVVSLPAGQPNTTVKGTLSLNPDFDESRVSISTVDRFATMAWTVASEAGGGVVRLELETNPPSSVDLSFVKIVATRVNDVVDNSELL
jgi:hypothetical protein